ncbi:hypothetical protein [Chitinibacter sp. GC72]|uniref:hypothetical protein n=1 Tax=Chitinibacter sp. GC72 TaxID=1526917 RepID=UPI0012FAAA5E|nr:hypothetical protein [Chitinibacter sp. GC72]
MSLLPALSGRDLFAQSSNHVGELQRNNKAADSKTDKIEQRVASLQKDTLKLAQDFLGQFASQLFGDAAKGMQISFDQFELSASSEASMSLSRSSDGTSSTRSASFSLNDSSSFTGRGTISTADGRQFEFELSVTYESRQQMSYTEQTKRTSSPNTAAQPADTSAARGMNYQGTADELLDSISATPVQLPFKLKDQDGDEQVMGDLVLKLLNLSGGDRFYDWFGNKEARIDQNA